MFGKPKLVNPTNLLLKIIKEQRDQVESLSKEIGSVKAINESLRLQLAEADL